MGIRSYKLRLTIFYGLGLYGTNQTKEHRNTRQGWGGDAYLQSQHSVGKKIIAKLRPARDVQ